MPSDPETFRFADDGAIPNKPQLSVLVYRSAFDPVCGVNGLLMRLWNSAGAL